MRRAALALLEYAGVAAGTLAVDRMLKRSPISLLRCGTVHPGRYLALVGGSVGSTQEAHAEGIAAGAGALLDDICLADPHPALAAALDGVRQSPGGDAVVVVETATSPAIVRVVDAVLKALPVSLVEIRLADDLGGRGVAMLAGALPDVREALEIAAEPVPGRPSALVGTALMPRLDDTLRRVIGEGSTFAGCRRWEPEGAESVEEGTCSSAE